LVSARQSSSTMRGSWTVPCVNLSTDEEVDPNWIKKIGTSCTTLLPTKRGAEADESSARSGAIVQPISSSVGAEAVGATLAPTTRPSGGVIAFTKRRGDSRWLATKRPPPSPAIGARVHRDLQCWPSLLPGVVRRSSPRFPWAFRQAVGHRASRRGSSAPRGLQSTVPTCSNQLSTARVTFTVF